MQDHNKGENISYSKAFRWISNYYRRWLVATRKPSRSSKGAHYATIVFVSPQGSVGKATAALLLASKLSRAAPITVVDADINDPIAAWAKDASLPDNLCRRRGGRGTMLDWIRDATAKAPLVVVDREGTAAEIDLLAVN